MKRKKTKKLLEGKRIEFAQQNVKYDNKIVYRQGEDINHIKYYDLNKKTAVESQAFKYNSDRYFFPDFETKAYFIGASGEKRLSVMKKTDFYKQAFDKVVSIGW